MILYFILENVLTEVIDLFPSPYIHIGGDEVDKTSWKKCAKCQQRIRSEKLKDEDELQSYFIKRIEQFVNSKKKKSLVGMKFSKGIGPRCNRYELAWRSRWISCRKNES